MGSIIDKGINGVEGVGGEETVIGEEDDGEMRLKNIQMVDDAFMVVLVKDDQKFIFWILRGIGFHHLSIEH